LNQPRGQWFQFELGALFSSVATPGFEVSGTKGPTDIVLNNGSVAIECKSVDTGHMLRKTARLQQQLCEQILKTGLTGKWFIQIDIAHDEEWLPTASASLDADGKPRTGLPSWLTVAAGTWSDR